MEILVVLLLLNVQGNQVETTRNSVRRPCAQAPRVCADNAQPHVDEQVPRDAESGQERRSNSFWKPRERKTAPRDIMLRACKPFIWLSIAGGLPEVVRKQGLDYKKAGCCFARLLALTHIDQRVAGTIRYGSQPHRRHELQAEMHHKH